MRGQLNEIDVANPNLMWRIRCQPFACLTLTGQALANGQAYACLATATNDSDATSKENSALKPTE